MTSDQGQPERSDVKIVLYSVTVANEMPDSHMSQQSNLDIFDNFKS